MTQLNQVYKCAVCGNVVEVVHSGGGELVCCGQPMSLQLENSVDASIEKHVPIIEETVTGIKVTVGSVLHPMEDAHYIEWVEIITDNGSCKHFLKPGDAPTTEFHVKPEKYTVRAYCNLHGLWKR